jgi:acetate kinase
MTILVLNSGGSSLKYKLYAMPDETVLAAGDIDRLGTPAAVLRHRVAGRPPLTLAEPAADHLGGIRQVLALLCHPEHGCLADLRQLDAVAHKLPHGGEVSGARRIDGEVIAALERFAAVVPVHNPPVLRAIAAFSELLPDTPQLGTFETHFHVTLPPAAYRYALPEAWYARHGVRRYGFHSCSHRFVAGRAAELLGRPIGELRTVICHLGSGTSVCGVRHGRSVEISSGFTPQAGTPMSTRSGDFDPFVLTYLQSAEGWDAAELNRQLTTEAGLAGLSGVGGDLRDIEAAAAAGDPRAQLAIDVFVFNIRRWIGACLMACGGIDALAFSGGIGERDPGLRAAVCAGLDWLGLALDPAANAAGAEGLVSAADSRVAVLTVNTDEELVVARDAVELLQRGSAS